jgi:hypothetical protein
LEFTTDQEGMMKLLRLGVVEPLGGMGGRPMVRCCTRGLSGRSEVEGEGVPYGWVVLVLCEVVVVPGGVYGGVDSP